MQENGSLSTKQQELLALLINGEQVEKAAATVKISPSTAYRWQKNKHFQEKLEAGKEDLFQQVLVALQRKSLNTLNRHIGANVEVTAASQVKAVALVLEQLFMRQKVIELEGKLDELARLLERT